MNQRTTLKLFEAGRKILRSKIAINDHASILHSNSLMIHLASSFSSFVRFTTSTADIVLTILEATNTQQKPDLEL